jgi:protein-disulfide isomerase
MICHLRTTAIGFGLLATLACQHPNQNQPHGDGSGGPATSAAAAIIDGRTVTVGELDDFIKEGLFSDATLERNPANLYEVRSRGLKEMIDEMVVEKAASAANLSSEDYLNQQVEAEGEVPEKEIAAFYEEHIDQMGGLPLDEMRDRISAFMKQQRTVTIVGDLRDQAAAEICLEPARVEVEAIGPSKGPDDAVVTIVEFSDFECPFCGRVVPTIDMILAKYPTQVRFVYRNLPLTIHPRAQAAAEAAACAGNQGNFWDYHDLVFANRSAVSDEDLELHASELGLDMQAFRQCVQNRETQQIVETDIAAAESLRISGTPSFVINGIPLHGAQGLEAFSKVIDAEIERISADGSKATRCGA